MTPKGLLDLTGPSTSAIHRTLQLELLKSAGYDFSNKVNLFQIDYMRLPYVWNLVWEDTPWRIRCLGQEF